MMTIGSVLLGIALLFVVGLFIARPLLVSEGKEEERFSTLEALTLQKEALLEQIRELDFDHETGKMPDDQYETLRAEMMAEATAILQQLDALQPATAHPATAAVEADIEAAVARLRQQQPEVAAQLDEEVEAAVARVRHDGAAVATRPKPVKTKEHPTSPKTAFCSQCGQPKSADDKFCAYCGNSFV